MGVRMASAESQVRFEDAVEFFDKLLRKDSECRLVDEYPLVFNASYSDLVLIDMPADLSNLPDWNSKKLSQLLVIRENGELRAGLGCLRRKIQLDKDVWLDALFVGSVVTAPEYRNLGYQRELFQILERMAKNAEMDLILLWSNQLEFYQKLGFILGGLQATWSSIHKEPLVKEAPPVTFGSCKDVLLKSEWFEAFQKKPLCVSRRYEEMQILWQIPHMYVACTANAYALFEKGEDFGGMCHEWAGPADEVLACMDRLRQVRQDLKILSPGVIQETEELKVIRKLEANQFDARLEYLGLFKILNPRFVQQDLQPETLKLPFFVWGLDSI